MGKVSQTSVDTGYSRYLPLHRTISRYPNRVTRIAVRQILVQDEEHGPKVCVASIERHALLNLIGREVINELRKDG
jgi:hypothetical protein